MSDLLSVRRTWAIRAVDTIVGPHLSELVVEDDYFAQLCFQKTRLGVCSTLIPINRVRCKMVSSRRCFMTRFYSLGRSAFALQLVYVQQGFGTVLNYVFGNVIVCFGSKVASRSSFEMEGRVRTVSLRGLDFNSAGFLAGGDFAGRYSGLFLNEVYFHFFSLSCLLGFRACELFRRSWWRMVVTGICFVPGFRLYLVLRNFNLRRGSLQEVKSERFLICGNCVLLAFVDSSSYSCVRFD